MIILLQDLQHQIQLITLLYFFHFVRSLLWAVAQEAVTEVFMKIFSGKH